MRINDFEKFTDSFDYYPPSFSITNKIRLIVNDVYLAIVPHCINSICQIEIYSGADISSIHSDYKSLYRKMEMHEFVSRMAIAAISGAINRDSFRELAKEIGYNET